jgi:hypothetical protein
MLGRAWEQIKAIFLLVDSHEDFNNQQKYNIMFLSV